MKIDKVRAGIVGYGMGKIYAAALKNLNSYFPTLPPVELVGLATSTAVSAEEGRKRFGFPFVTNNYLELFNHPDINLLILAAPNDLHYEMLLQALPSRKWILADKPLTQTLEQAEHLAQFAKETQCDLGLIFEFRYAPALQLAKEMISLGRLGQTYSFRAEYFRSSYSDPSRSLRWKSSAARGGGVWHDLGAHVVDLVTWLIGIPEKVCAQQRIFIPRRPSMEKPGDYISVETDDHALVMAQLANDGIGTFETGRLITGAVNDLQLTFYGSQGSIRWSLMDRDVLYFSDRSQASTAQTWQKINPLSRIAHSDLPPGDFGTDMFGYILAAIADFILKAIQNQPFDPGLHQGLQVQAILEAAKNSAKLENWEAVPYFP